MMMVTLFRPAHTAEKFLGPIRASAVKAIGFFVIDALHFVLGVQRNASQELLSSALTIVPLAMRERMNERACPSLRNTAGSERPLRSRMMTTALRLPL
jgi:hypothetical protein